MIRSNAKPAISIMIIAAHGIQPEHLTAPHQRVSHQPFSRGEQFDRDRRIPRMGQIRPLEI
jgi:hypothetical protein